MVHSVFGGFLHHWVQGDQNRSSTGRDHLTSTSQGFVWGWFFFKILVPNLTTRTIYQAPVKIRGQSSLAIAGHGSRLHAETPPCPMATCGEVGAQALVTTSTLGLGSGCSCLGGHCWRKRGSSQWSCYMDIMEVLGTLQMEKRVFDRHWNLEPLD